jgi:hypothetical protein
VSGVAAELGILAVLAHAALVEPLPALRGDGTKRYRMEVAGEPVGVATLRVRCQGDGCEVRFETETRMPEGGGGGVVRRAVAVRVDRTGRVREPGGTARPPGVGASGGLPPGPFASLVAEVVLSALVEVGEVGVAPVGEGRAGPGASGPGAGRRCIEVLDGETGRSGQACAERAGAWLEGSILGEPARFRGRPGEFPDEVRLPDQGARFVADGRASVPRTAPRLLGLVVPAVPGTEGAGESGLEFCGVPDEPADPEPPPPGVPLRFPEEGSCREQTAGYLAAARREGIAGRHAVGVAWDGARFVWHEWAELSVGDRWVAVDPAFRQVPAAGPRFVVARYEDGDDAARAAAGRRVLACWGRARVRRGGDGGDGAGRSGGGAGR